MKNKNIYNAKGILAPISKELVSIVLNDPFFKNKKKEAIEFLEKIGLPDGQEFKAPPEIKKELFL
jgi:hypothetical protein